MILSARRIQTIRSELQAIATRLSAHPAHATIGAMLRRACETPGIDLQVALKCGQRILNASRADSDLLDEAQALYGLLAQQAPKHVQARVGLAKVAMRRGRWPEAVDHWEEVRQLAGDHGNPVWTAQHATALAESGKNKKAETTGRPVGKPGAPFVDVKLARAAMQRKAWPEALAHWDSVLARSDVVPDPAWLVARANVLKPLELWEEAEAQLRAVVSTHPEVVPARRSLVQVLIRTGQGEAAMDVLLGAPDGWGERPEASGLRIAILMRLRRLDEARVLFYSAMAETRDPAALGAILSYAPAIFEGWALTKAWLAMLERVDAISARGDAQAGRGLRVVRLRSLFGLRDYEGFLAAFDEVRDVTEFGEFGRSIASIAATLREPSFPDYEKLKVFGIGLSKTGTTSLAAALGTLGFNTLDWADPLCRQLMVDDHLHLFDAFTDLPACAAFERYYRIFPNSLFIQTVRPFEDWQKSWSGHLKRHYGIGGFTEGRDTFRARATKRQGTRHSEIFLAFYFHFSSYEEAYEDYERRVRTFFQDKPTSRFMRFDLFAGDGWPQLCGFLGKPQPDTPFPHSNKNPRPDL